MEPRPWLRSGDSGHPPRVFRAWRSRGRLLGKAGSPASPWTTRVRGRARAPGREDSAAPGQEGPGRRRADAAECGAWESIRARWCSCRARWRQEGAAGSRRRRARRRRAEGGGGRRCAREGPVASAGVAVTKTKIVH